jgi:hypothetical protein
MPIGNKFIPWNPADDSDVANKNSKPINFEQKYYRMSKRSSEDVVLNDNKLLAYADRLISSDCISENENGPKPGSSELILEQIQPNPLSSLSSISFYLPESKSISLSVYDLSGNKVMSLIDNKQYESGWHSISISSADFRSGVYFYSLIYGELVLSKSMIVIE